MEADVKKAIDDLKRQIDSLRANKVDNHFNGEFLARNTLIRGDDGKWYEVTANTTNPSSVVIRFTDMGERKL